MPQEPSRNTDPAHTGVPPDRFRFPSTSRLKRKSDFAALFRDGSRRGAGPLLLRLRPNGASRPRLALAVPRRVGNAVVRNKVKRRLREAYRLIQHDLPGSYDALLSVRRHEPLSVVRYTALLRVAWHDLDASCSRGSPGKP